MWWLAPALAAELSGTLVGADGQGIVGARVYAYDSRFNYASATTRNGGAWTIVGLPADGYRLRYLPPNANPHGDRFHGGAWESCSAEVVPVPEEGSVVAGVDDTLGVGATATGQVVDLDGTPIPGIRVTLYGAEPRTSLISRDATTDEDGRFVVTGLDAEDSGSAFFVQFEGAGWPAQWAGPTYSEDESERTSLAAGGTVEFGAFALLDGIRVYGTIRGPDGPVPAGTAFVYSSQQILTSTLGADGTFVADGLPPGDVVLWASSPGLATTYFPDSDRPDGSVSVPDEGADVPLELTLPPESTLTLYNEGAAEFGDVSVLVYNDTYTVGRGDHLDESGRVTLSGLHPGDYFVYVYGQDAGFTSGFLNDDAGEPLVFPVDGATELPLPLEAGATLRGLITDDAGEPVYGATVQAVETTEAARRWTTTTARDGTYELRGVDATTVTLSAAFYWYCATDPGWAPTWYPAARAASAAGVLLVEHGDTLEGMDLVMPADDDHDGMGDAWEIEHGLDPDHDDAAGDPDADGFTNAEEWELDTDPNDAGGDLLGDCEGCGEGSAGGAFLAGLAALGWLRRRRYQT